MGYSEADRERIRQGARLGGVRGMRAAEEGLRRFGFRGGGSRRDAEAGAPASASGCSCPKIGSESECVIDGVLCSSRAVVVVDDGDRRALLNLLSHGHDAKEVYRGTVERLFDRILEAVCPE